MAAPVHTREVPVNVLLALLKTMRPRQWAKNVFVFAGIVFDQQLILLESVVRVSITFVLLSLTASAIYVLNDLVDIEKDRQHPTKRNRPLPSGELPVRVAQIAAVLLPVLGIGGGFLLSPPLGFVLSAYYIIHVVYSFYLKNVVLLDIFAISAGFILRVIAGVVVISVRAFSPWLYMCMGLLSLFLAIGKRRQEFVQLGDDASKIRPAFAHYNMDLLNDMLRLVITATAIAYTLYATEAETALIAPSLMLLTVPFVYYALFRYLYVIHVKGDGGDPTEVLYTDRPLQVSIVLWAGVVVLLLYFGDLLPGV
ncbi:MAG: decaprenyl-phosphate phosphoribosyltransferase [Chloroflexota bacterium]